MTAWSKGCRQCDRTDAHTHGKLAADGHELRYLLDEHGQLRLDEVVARGVDVHLEQMDGPWWWLGITLPDGSRLMVTIGARNHRSSVDAVVDVEAPWSPMVSTEEVAGG